VIAQTGKPGRIVRLALGICFALQATMVPGLHRHAADGHDPVAATPGRTDCLVDVAGCARHGAQLAAHPSFKPVAHHNSANCPACLFLKNFQGRTGAGKIPAPALTPDSRALQSGDLPRKSRTIITAFPRAPPHHS
jgi:hypothetical protein